MALAGVGNLLASLAGMHALRRPLHIIQPRAAASRAADDPVHVPRRFLLFAQLWHSLPVQAALTILCWCCAHRKSTRFVILAMPRSGSTALVHALNGHPRVACAGEILNPGYRVYGDVSPPAPGWRRALHIDAILSALAARLLCLGAGRAVCVGFKALDEQLCFQGYGASLRALCRGCALLSGGAPPRVILLARRDLRAAFASRLRAHRTGVWYQDGAERAAACAPDADAPAAAGAGCEAAAAREYAAWTCDVWRNLERELRAPPAVPTLRLYHEDWAAQPEHVLREVAAFLGLPPLSPSELEPMLRRAAESAPLSGRAPGHPPGSPDDAHDQQFWYCEDFEPGTRQAQPPE